MKKSKIYITGVTGTEQADSAIKRLEAGIREILVNITSFEAISSSEINKMSKETFKDPNHSANYRVAAVANATHLVLVDGWQNCKVATFERTTALFLGITVLTESEISANALLCQE